MSYAEKIFALSKQWAKARDSRSAPRLAPRLFPALWFVMFAARLPGFNALVQLRRSASLNRWLGTLRTPSAKELAIVSESADPDVLRDIVGFLMQRLRRNKHFVAVLKENQPDLLDEARRLPPTEPPESFSLPATVGKCHRQVELRQAEGFTTDST